LFNLPPFLSIATGTPYLFNSNHWPPSSHRLLFYLGST
jgi:hypothetical protein